MIGQAQTGSGKTAAFGLPMHRVRRSRRSSEVQALVLTPTRELCIQVTQALRAYGAAQGRRRRRRLRRRADPLPAGPAARRRARRRRHRRPRDGPDLSAHSLILHDCRFVVLDEADEMLDLGFLEDVERILGADAQQPPDRAVQRDDAAADPRARRPLPLRPGARSRSRPRRSPSTPSSSSTLEVKPDGEGRHARRACSRPSGPTRRSSSCARRSAATSSTARCATAA